MPRPNKPRAIHAERNLAQRIAAERAIRSLTYDDLAQRMTDAGCPMAGSAIYKIEKSDPPRRIVVDELIAFSAVFGVPVDELLMPSEEAVQKEFVHLVRRCSEARRQVSDAESELSEATAALWNYAEAHPKAAGIIDRMLPRRPR